jgi:meiotically up-regulated gene 157 (Mug157) protein
MSTTVQHYNLTQGNESTYIITGDIEAMWLRDSTNQFIPYIRMPKNCTYMPALTRGLLNVQAEFLMVDGYTNAFKRY